MLAQNIFFGMLFKKGGVDTEIIYVFPYAREDRLFLPFKLYSQNVQDIIENFKFRNQIPTLSKADALGTLINKFLDPTIDLTPAGIDNHAMGTVFEELVRKFNEDNNEEDMERGRGGGRGERGKEEVE